MALPNKKKKLKQMVIERKPFDMFFARQMLKAVRVSENDKDFRTSITFWGEEVEWIFRALQEYDR